MKTDEELLALATQDGWYCTELFGDHLKWNNLRNEGELQWITCGDWMSPVLRRALRAKYDRYSLRSEMFGL
jgi:hypothetical protein